MFAAEVATKQFGLYPPRGTLEVNKQMKVNCLIFVHVAVTYEDVDAEKGRH